MQGFEFMLHQMISTTVVTRFWLEPEISTPNKSVTCSSFLLPQDVLFSGQSSGTSIWVLQVSVSYQNVYLLANQHTPVFSGTDCTLYQRQTQPSIVIPQRAERYNHLALWLPESMCNGGQQGLMGQG